MARLRLFDIRNYKKYVLLRIDQMPNGGYGQMQKIAHFLNVHPTLISQVFRGSKNLTSEQAIRIGEFFGLNERETHLFLALVERERAGTRHLKEYWQKRIDSLVVEDKQVANRIAPAEKLSKEQQIEFYSTWEYSATRLASSISQYQTPDAIAERLGLTAKRVNEIIEFLLNSGLCVQKNNLIGMGPTRTHIASDSPLVSRHHLNWRLKALETHSNLRAHELAFTAPVSIALNDRGRVRDILLETIEKVSRLVSQSNAENLACLNLDWFDLRSANKLPD